MTERPNLSDAFKGGAKAAPNRAQNLTGLLAPRAAPESAAAPARPATTPATESTPAPKQRPPAASPSASGSDAVSSVPAYIEPEVLKIATKTIRQREMTYDGLLVEAFESISDDKLREYFAPKPAADGATAMPTRVRAPRGTAGIQRQFRLDGAQKAWIDGKRAAVSAPSRSALIAAVLRLHLL